MKCRFYFIFIFISTIIFSLTTSCSEAEVLSSDTPELTQSIFIVPESYFGEPYKQYAAAEKFYIDLNKKVRICGVYALDSEFIPIDQSNTYYSSHKWIIDNNEVNASSLYYTFDKAGVHKISFVTVDNLGDTLTSHANVYVNTPVSLSLQFPPNKYNQVDGENATGLELSWNVYGIDSWESSICVVYASYYEDKVWERPLGETECTESVDLMGRLNLDINEYGDSVNHSINNSTIYWGVRAVTKNDRGNIEQYFSDIFSFSTILENNQNAIIEVPVTCMFSQYPEKSQLKGAFISASGDTLAKFSKIKANSVIRQALSPQSNIKIVVCDTALTEYSCNSMTVNLPPSTKTITDTLFLQDKVKPNMVPSATELPTTAQMKFFLLDNGSGINASKIVAMMNEDTLQTTFNDNILSIPNTCKKDCALSIYAEDYAKNKAPDIYWRVKVNKAITNIEGPYAKTEDK